MNNSRLGHESTSLDNVWICAAEVDERKEKEKERIKRLLKKRSKKQGRGKYEIDPSHELEVEIEEKRRKLRDEAIKHSPQSSQRHSRDQQKKLSVYELENKRLSLLLRDQKLSRRLQKKRPRPRIVHDMLSIEKAHTRAATKIQQWIRQRRRKQFMAKFVNLSHSAVHIQRLSRGFLCRRLVSSWHIYRTAVATRFQAIYRSYKTRKQLQVWHVERDYGATKIQTVARVLFAKSMVQRKRKRIAVIRIQCWIRAIKSRLKTWLISQDEKAVNLQRLIRGVQARKRVSYRRELLNASAIQIQRMFRGMLARVKIEHILCDRETENRKELMLILEAEEEWYRAQRDRLVARLERFGLKDEVMQREEEYVKSHKKILNMEAIYLDMQTQRARLSPRAIEQGWVEEMEDKMKKHRSTITRMKMDALFGVAYRLRSAEQSLQDLQEEICKLEYKRCQFRMWREEEYMDYWERECRIKSEKKKVEQRQNIASQRRRWRIQFYSKDGKPNKHWKGTTWTDEILTEAENKQKLSFGSIQLLTSMYKKHQGYQSSDREDTIPNLVNQVALTNTLNQTEQLKEIFRPVLERVGMYHEAAHDMTQEQQEAKRSRDYLRAVSREKLQTPVISLRQNRKPRETPDREAKKQKIIQAGQIPWHLLDRIAAERHQLLEARTIYHTWGKAPLSFR